ncbi:uncharacterized protein N7518_006018 [Penicillium psychrosexuale]|uniref:uncharacterized protein n=1 Tax=Penicillium psychrosexuale TaxID=1002107 RepID=UPI0025451AB8|nr:uncharacterized protein N7518_006018 [Penicillium psychrosexuale]KAJ5789007.1 hypothetical protein N7518_006018 [Penicillium psychrosexuale]
MAEDILRKEGLPATTPRYRRAFREDFNEFADRLLQKAFLTYYFSSQTLILRVTVSSIHQTSWGTFSEIFASWHRAQENRLVQSGGDVQGTTRVKKPDCSWKPAGYQPNRDVKWPTVVVEAGWSETLKKLKEDASFWLHESNQQVQVMLTIRTTERGTITIEKWAVDRNSVKPVQKMWIVRNRNHDSQNHQISGSIQIPFQECYLRAKRNSETDFVMSHSDMLDIAQSVWHFMDELPQ